ncbi:transposase [Sporomusa silvacetica]|uniref:transposase n=1 Tax=Sporomusa silvacetica TaxID=55504 RepID=UPI001FE4C81F|nr:transposase [Sporomusa silvacetica]
MIRGINKQNIFEDEDDRQRFLETLGYYITLSSYLLYGYCLMGNHIHLIIKGMNESISQVIKRISSSYVYWYNQRHE